MSQTPPTASSSSNFRAIFYASMKEYERKAKKDLLAHPLMAQLQACDSPAAILAVLRTLGQQVERSDDPLTKWLGPTVNVLYAFSGVLGADVGLEFSPANVIFAGAGVLLSAAKDVLASQDALIDIFERFEIFFRRLESYTGVSMTEAMMDVAGKIMVEVLGIFATVTKEIKQGRAKKFLKRLIGRRDIEEALSRLDKLTQEGARMAAVQILELTHDIKYSVETVGDNMHDRVMSVEDKVGKIIEDGKMARMMALQTANNMDEERRIGVREEQRKWLCPPDPSTNQNIACVAQSAGTAAWFLHGSIFMKWRNESTTTLLWIHGKLGSGKSVLCSAIIEDLMPLRDAGQVSMAYFYFDVRDLDKQTLHSLLPSLLTQLSTRSDHFCDILSRVYKTHDHGTRKPSTSMLMACLKEMLTLPGHGPIYIILDALDECPNTSGIPSAREQLLAFLKDLVGLQLSHLHICVTSRPEIDIRVALEPLTPHLVSLHDQSGQRKDIEDYVRSVVYADSEKAMGRWRDEDKEMVIQTLTERADGMFRWVFCQLEALRHCLPHNIRRTLHELPEALDPTYERVLNEIGLADWDHAHRLLQCLTVAIRPLHIEELAEILVSDFDGAEGATPNVSGAWRREDRQKSVLSICSGLITLVSDGDSRVIQFSHFSVKEFLTSDRLATSKRDTSHFHIKPEAAHTTLAQACLGILLQLDGSSNDNDVEDIFPLTRYASRHWVGHAQFGLVSSRIEDGMRRLFDSTKPYFSAWLQLHDIDETWDNFGTYETTERGSPLYYASLCGFRDLAAYIILTHPEQVNATGGRNYSPLAAALHKRHFDVAELLYQHGAGVDVTGFTSHTPLQVASAQRLIDVVRWLLDHGADDQDNLSMPILGPTNGDLEVGEPLLPPSVQINAANYTSYMPVNAAIENLKADEILTSHNYDSENPSRETSSPPTLHHSHNQSSMPPSPATHPSPPAIAARGLRSFGERELSPVPDAAVNTTQPITSMRRAAPQGTTGVSVQLPADSLVAAATPATIAPAHSPFATLAPALSLSPAMFPGRVGGQKSSGDGTVTPLSTRWGNLKGKGAIPIEQAEGYTHTRSRIIGAIGGALGTAASIGHEALFAGVDLLQFAPVPGLNTAGNILLNIWDSIEMVETNRQASLRLAERCADILISTRSEIAAAGYTVTEELRVPIAKLVEAFEKVYHFLDKLGKRPFLKRLLWRKEILSGISACDTALKDALDLFDRSIYLRTMKLIQVDVLQQQKETHDLLESLTGLPPAHPPSSPAALQLSPADPESVRNTLHALQATQNAQDRARDMADLHQLMRSALAENDDVAMVEVLQIARSEMPDAIKTLERALELVIEDAQLVAEQSTMAPLLPQPKEAGKGDVSFFEPGNTGASHIGADTLDRKFIETGIGALRRLSKGADLGLPSWTITWFEIEREAMIGVGSFSNVYRGTWRQQTVAIKVLSETTPRKIFLREVGIWKSLHHPNVLELFGASSASGDPPWFLVSKYYPRGNLVKYLKCLSDTDAARVDALKMIHEISKGMAYLHKQKVLHGDLKAANILVDDDARCVISDFGQSEIKSEVYRLTRASASQPRGTLRWQAPELMQGAEVLTQEMDIYAFAVCCREILTMGALPWPFMDDLTVRHSVLNEDMRPSLPPPSNLVNDQLMNVIRASWDRFPSNRPSFEQITHELKKQCAGRNALSINSQTSHDWE